VGGHEDDRPWPDSLRPFVHQGEAGVPHDRGEDDPQLEHGEARSDAAPRSASERNPSVAVGRLLEEALGSEFVRVGVDVGPPMEQVDGRRNIDSRREPVAIDDDGLRESATHGRDHRPQAQRLLDGCLQDNYFPGKDAVLDEFGRNLIASYVQLAAQELALEDHTVDQRVRALARACGRAFSSDPEFMTIVVTRSRAFGGRGQLPARDDPIYGLLAQLFAEGQASGEVRRDVPPIELAETFSGIFMFTVVSWLAERPAATKARDDEADLDARLMRSFDVFLDGSNQR
jgi:AcrR family transcriptional regulator